MIKDHPCFRVVKLDQRTDAWREWRHQGIGASDAPIIMGENPWKDAADLLHAKRQPARDPGRNAAMTFGEDCEPDALTSYVSRTGNAVAPICLESKEHPWMRASLDGMSADASKIVEVKCGASAYRKVSQFGEIPDYYYGQTQHILAVAGADSMDFWCYLPDRPGLLVAVPRNEGYIKRLIAAEKNFWKRINEQAVSTLRQKP